MENKLQRTKNYLFQNYDYVEKPVNFKHVVIDLLRRYGLFIHMRKDNLIKEIFAALEPFDKEIE